MRSELATVNNSALDRRNDLDDLRAIFSIAEQIFTAGKDFIPAHYKTPGAVAAAMIAGRELGLPVMLSLRTLYVIGGKVGIDAGMQLSLIKRAGIVHEWVRDGSDRKTATLKLTRHGHKPYDYTYTFADAEHAGLLKNPLWKTHTASMLRARAVSGAVRAYCPDVLSGVYVPDELTEMAEPAHVAPEPDPAAIPTSGIDVTTGEVLDPPPEFKKHKSPAQQAMDDLMSRLEGIGTTEEAAQWFLDLEALEAPGKVKRRGYDAWGAGVRKVFGLDPAEFADQIRNSGNAAEPYTADEIP